MKRAPNFFEQYPLLAALLGWPPLFVLLYWKVLVHGNVFVFIDASRFFFPMWKWGAAVLQQGLIPLWNPDAQFGCPYLADPQTACAYPPVALFYSWFLPIQAFSVLIILHHIWCVLGTWVWAREQGFSSKASFGTSLVFGFSLHVICSSWTPVALITISWLPWVLTGALRVFDRKRGSFLWLSFAWAMQLSAGYPVLVYLTGLALLAHLVWKTLALKNGEWTERFHWLFPVAVSVLAAVLYNLVWALPFLEYFKNSNYQSGASRTEDLGWIHFATLLDPFISSHPLDGKNPGIDYWIGTYFVGLPAICFLVWGFWKKAYRKNSFVLLVVFMVLSLGWTLRVGGWLKSFVPGYSLVIHSGFWLSLVLLWVAALSMESFESFIPKKPVERWGWSTLVTLVYAGIWALKTPYFPMLFWLSWVFLALAAWVQRVSLRSGMIFAALLLSLGPAALSMDTTMDRSYYEKPPEILSKLDKSGRFFFSPQVIFHGIHLQGKDRLDAYEGAKEALYPNWPLAYGREEAPTYNTLQLRNPSAWTFQVFQYSLQTSRKALDYLGLRYIFGVSHFSGLRKIETNDRVSVYENPSALPKWFSVGNALPASLKVEDDFFLITQKNIHLGETCFVMDGDKKGIYAKRAVTEMTRDVNSVHLFVKGKGKSLIVSSESDAPGWRAWVEGQERPVELINHAFRGVVLGPDEGNVTLRYEPVSFRLGLFLSLLMVGGWLGMVLFGLLSGPKRRV